MTAAPNDRALIGRIAARVDQLLAEATGLCRKAAAAGLRPRLRFDLHGQTAGQAIWRQGRQPELRFNLDIGRRHADDFVRQTVAHEVAHIVTYQCFGRTRPHGREWQSVMRHFGIDRPTRCHDYVVDGSPLRRQRRWIYACSCRTHHLSTTRHNRVQHGKSRYHCRNCGDELGYNDKPVSRNSE